MTAETSNARGEWSLVPHTPTPEMIEAGILFGTSPNKATIIYQSMVNAAPPPAAARGDVRGLVAKWREHAAKFPGSQSGVIAACHADELESALAAEGVQAGEVEIGYGWELDRYGFPNAGASQPAPFIDGYWTPWHIAQRRLADALSLSQQPEARGVVDGVRSERAWPVIGNLYLVKIGGVLQHEVFMFDQGDCEPGGSAPPFWSRDGLDDCPEFDPHKDQWISLDEIDAALTGERNG